MNSKDFIENSNKNIFQTYKRFPIVLVKGKGFKVWDAEGKEYFDFVSGLAVNNLGHCHPRVVMAIKRQADELIHVSNLYHNIPQIELAKKLVEVSFAQKVFFCNSGAEANEAAIKLARKYAKEKFHPDRYEIITFNKSFHGRTMATITATAQEKFHKGFEPLLPGFKYVPYNDLGAFRDTVSENTAAILIEPIQGEGGVNVAGEKYLQELCGFCREKRILVVFDEVQTGMGRTGKMFAYEHFGLKPDIMSLAKSLGGGMAIGAMLATEEVSQAFSPGTHASTFGGNPLACSAGLAAIQAIIDENMLGNCRKMGDYLLEKLSELKSEFGFIKEVRGKGLIIGMELAFPGEEIVSECMEKGFLVNCTMGNVLRFLPPLNIGRTEIDLLIKVLKDIFGKRK